MHQTKMTTKTFSKRFTIQNKKIILIYEETILLLYEYNTRHEYT